MNLHRPCSFIPHLILCWNNITRRTGSIINQIEDITQDSIFDTSSKSSNYLLHCYRFCLGDRKLWNILPHVAKLISLFLVIKHSDALWGCTCCSISAAKFSIGSCGCVTSIVNLINDPSLTLDASRCDYQWEFWQMTHTYLEGAQFLQNMAHKSRRLNSMWLFP